MATELSANNPELIDSLRRNMDNRTQPNENNESAPDSNSQGSTGIFNRTIRKKSV